MPAVPYHLDKFPPPSLDWPRLVPLLGPTAAAIARFDGTLAVIPNAAVLLAPLMTHEAVLSSRIEGTQATMGEVLQFRAGDEQSALSAERRHDIHEVLNYQRAMVEAAKQLDELPLCWRVLRQTHRVLLDGARGHGKDPGEFRKIPNWIGPAGCTIDQARFIPIGVEHLTAAASRWESFLHEDFADRLLQLAILHAEFEALHPFLDGNGRLGRLIIPLWMWRQGIIRQPIFYMSAWLEAHRDDYYERLLAVSRDDDWTGWCAFFLGGLRAQAEENEAKAKAIVALHASLRHKVSDWTRSAQAIKAVDWIFATPYFYAPTFVAQSGIADQTARRILNVLRDKGLLTTVVAGRGRRPGLYMFSALVDIAEGRPVDLDSHG